MSDIFGSSSEDERSPSPQPQEGDGGGRGEEEKALFGSDDDDDEEEFDERAEAPRSKPMDAPEGEEGDAVRGQREGLDDLFGSDDEGAGERRGRNEPRAKTTSELQLPDLQKTLPDGTLAIASTMPSYLRIQSRPFVSSEHDSVQERQALEGAIDVIRWRTKVDADGNPVRDAHGNIVRESNARMVKWSDGSYQLLVGDEVFDATLLPLYHSFSYARQRSEAPSDSQSQSSQQQAQAPSSCLRSVGGVPQKMKLFPHSVHSEAHARMSAKVTDKYVAATKLSIKHHDTLSQDPERESQARIDEENVRLREDRKRRAAEGFGASGSKRRYGSGMNAQFLEEEDRGEYDSTSLSALKKGRGSQGRGAFGRRLDSEGEEEEDEEADERDGEMDDFIVNDDAGEEDDEDEEGEYVEGEEEEGGSGSGSGTDSGSEASSGRGKNSRGKSRIKRRGGDSDEDMELDEDGESEESFRDSDDGSSGSGEEENDEEEEEEDEKVEEKKGKEKRESESKRPPAPSRPMRKIVDSDDD